MFFFFLPNNHCKICAFLQFSPHTPPPFFPIFPSLHLACTEVSSPDFFKLLSLCTPLVSIPILCVAHGDTVRVSSNIETLSRGV